jgi:hypothetical protein
MAIEHLGPFDVTIVSDYALQHYVPLDSRLGSQRRIFKADEVLDQDLVAHSYACNQDY